MPVLQCTNKKAWKDIAAQLGIGPSSSGAYTLKKHYGKNLLPFECQFERGGVDPGPILAQVEAASKKKGQKGPRPPSPGSQVSQPNQTKDNKTSKKVCQSNRDFAGGLPGLAGLVHRVAGRLLGPLLPAPVQQLPPRGPEGRRPAPATPR